MLLKRASLAALVTLGVAGYFVRADNVPAGSQSGHGQGTRATLAAAELPKADADGFIDMFNGKDLTGWHGLEGFWSAKDGMIVGSETKEKSKQTFLVYTAIPQIGDFEMHYKYKFASRTGNSGVQFRSKIIDPKTSRAGGYQADCDGEGHYDGGFYDEAGVAGGRGIMSNRGDKTVWDKENKRHNSPLPDAKDLKQYIKVGDWNDVVLKVHGNHMSYEINGHLMTEMIDDSPKALHEGIIALQIHQGFTMEIDFKDLKIKPLKHAE